MELRARSLCSLGRVVKLIPADDVSSFGIAIERHHAEARGPSLELAYPVRDSGIGNHDKGRISCIYHAFPALYDLAEEGDDLHCLALQNQINNAIMSLLDDDDLPNPSRLREYNAGGSTNC